MVPLFARLQIILLAALEQAEPGAEFVITRYRDSRSNLRTQAHRIIRRAGLEPWEKVFQNCRSSLETELVEDFPIQTVTSWLGNSPQIAQRHYLQVREEHFEKAVQKPVQCPAASGRTDTQPGHAETEKQPVCGPIREETALCVGTGPPHAPQEQPASNWKTRERYLQMTVPDRPHLLTSPLV